MGPTRLVASPGFWSLLLETRRRVLDLEIGAMTGPPSLRLIESHISGNLAEKLLGVSD